MGSSRMEPFWKRLFPTSYEIEDAAFIRYVLCLEWVESMKAVVIKNDRKDFLLGRQSFDS